MPRRPISPDLNADEFRARAITGEKMREQREAAGLSQDQLAQRVKTSRRMISHIETGREAVPPEIVHVLERILHLPKGYLWVREVYWRLIRQGFARDEVKQMMWRARGPLPFTPLIASKANRKIK